MDNEAQQSPPIPTTPEAPPPVAPPIAPTRAPTKWLPPVLFAGLFLLFAGVGIAGFQKLTAKPVVPVLLTPTPVASPTTVQTRALSPLATSSAFLTLELQIASLSGQIQSLVLDEASLTPPTLTLELGIKP